MIFVKLGILILIWHELKLLLTFHQIKRRLHLQEGSLYPWLFLAFMTLILLLMSPLFLILILAGALIIIYFKKNDGHQVKYIEFYGYKIFKYLLNQISSGILVTDAVLSMYMVVKSPKLRMTLLDLSAYYAQTGDIHGALQILKDRYKGLEVDTLCVAIEQGVATGSNSETLIKMEELLFKRYIFQIKRDTELKKKRGILAVLLLCLVIVLMVSIPITIDIGTAFNQIFY